MAGRSNTEAEALPSEAAQKVGRGLARYAKRPSPAPARSNGAYRFPVRRSPAGFVPRVRGSTLIFRVESHGRNLRATDAAACIGRARPGGPTCLTVSLPCPYSRGGRTVLSGYTRCYDFTPHWVPLALMSESTRGGRGHPAARDVRDGSDPRAPAGVRPNPRHSAARRISSAVSTGRHATISAKTSSRSTPPRSSTSDSTTSLATMAPAALDRSRRLGPDRTEGAPAPFTR
jgi:hypothetical protein